MNFVFRFEVIQQEPFEERALQQSTDTDPVGLLKKCRKRRGDLMAGARRLNWQHWTACYAGAFGIRRHPELFVTLLQDDYFKGRTYKADLDDLLRLALLIGMDAGTSGRTYKKACAIARRLQPLFDAEVEPMAVLKRIEAAGGLKRLDISDVVKAKPDDDDQDCDSEDDAELSEPSDDESDEADEDEEYDDEGDNDEEDDEEPLDSPTSARSPARPESSGRQTTSSRTTKASGSRKTAKQAKAQSKQATETSAHITRKVGDGMVILEVEVTKEMLGKVLGASDAFLHVKHAGSKEGWKRIVGATVASSADPVA